MKVMYKDTVLAESAKEDLIFIEGNWYFPPNSVASEYFKTSDTPYTCPWKGVCQYYTITIDGEELVDSAWTYPTPLPTAIERVKKDFSGYYAFYKDKFEISE